MTPHPFWIPGQGGHISTQPVFIKPPRKWEAWWTTGNQRPALAWPRGRNPLGIGPVTWSDCPPSGRPWQSPLGGSAPGPWWTGSRTSPSCHGLRCSCSQYTSSVKGAEKGQVTPHPKRGPPDLFRAYAGGFIHRDQWIYMGSSLKTRIKGCAFSKKEKN